MSNIYNFIILLCTFILYLHIIKHISYPIFDSISEIDFISNSNIQETCTINKPFIFQYISFDPLLFNNINIDTLIQNKFLNINIHNVNNNNVVVKNFNKSLFLFKKHKTKYFTINNTTFLINNNILNNFTDFHNSVKPSFLFNTTYDIISGSIFSYTPLNFHTFYNSFFIVVQGKISVKTVSLNFADELDFKFNDETLTYSSPINIWNFKNKKNIPIIDFSVFPGYVLFIPPYSLYSIKFLEQDTLIWSISYDTILTQSISSFNNSYNLINNLINQSASSSFLMS